MIKYTFSAILLLLAVSSSYATDVEVKGTALECSICEFVITTAEKFAVQNKSSAEVSKLLDLICEKVMPSTIRDECISFVNQYEPILVTLIVSQVSPDKICTLAGACNKTREYEKTPVEKKSILVPTPRSLNCTICKLVISEVQMQLKNNVSEQQIIAFMEGKLCVLAGPLEAVCKAAMSAFGPQILTMLANGVDPEKVCEFLQMCTPSHSKQVKAGINFQGTLECNICIYAAQFVDGYLKSNKTEAEITKDVEQICNVFPSTIKDECLSFLNEYAPYVIELAAQDLDPKAVCAKLKLCTNYYRK